MRSRIIIAFLPFLLAGVLSCDKDKDCSGDVSEYLVFGHFYGECGGEGCVEIFRIDDAKLYEDIKDQYPGSNDFYAGDFDTQLPDGKFELVKDLESFFPEALLNESEVVIGQPDAGDWGGIYFEIKRGSIHRFWLLDQMDSNMPAEYNEFVDRINEKIIIIHQ